MLVVMLSTSVLTRPWCLLEICEAMRKHKPMVLLDIKGPGKAFSFTDAFELLDNLEANLPALNPRALEELSALSETLSESLTPMQSLRELQDTVRTALTVARGRGVPHLDITGTAHRLEAQLVDLAECMAVAMNRTVRWTGGRVRRFSRGPPMKSLTKIIHRNLPIHRLSISRRSATKRTAPVPAAGEAFDERRSNSKQWGGAIPPMSRQSTDYGQSFAKHGLVYIIHESDAEDHALRLQEGVVAHSKKSCYVGIAELDGLHMEECLEQVARSTYVILLQTRSVLAHPWPLLATYHAARADVPIVCVMVQESGYDFEKAEYQLSHLEEVCSPVAFKQLSEVLLTWSPPRNVAALQHRLFKIIPQTISVVYNPTGTHNELAATVHDINDKSSQLLVRNRRRSSASMDEEELMTAAKAASKVDGESRPRVSEPILGVPTGPLLV
jgi:hypothetical protein